MLDPKRVVALVILSLVGLGLFLFWTNQASPAWFAGHSSPNQPPNSFREHHAKPPPQPKSGEVELKQEEKKNEGKEKVDLVVAIFSRAKRKDERDSFRKQWKTLIDPYVDEKDGGSISEVKKNQSGGLLNQETRYKIKAFFAIGKSYQHAEDIKRETELYRDILSLPFVDAYTNLTRKTRALMKHVDMKYETRYLFKMDINIAFQLDTLLSMLPYLPQQRAVIGRIWRGMQVLRDGSHPNAEFKWPLDIFPLYPSGPAYLLTGDVVSYFAHNSDWLRLFANEDASVGLWLAGASVGIYNIRGWLDTCDGFTAEGAKISLSKALTRMQERDTKKEEADDRDGWQERDRENEKRRDLADGLVQEGDVQITLPLGIHEASIEGTWDYYKEKGQLCKPEKRKKE